MTARGAEPLSLETVARVVAMLAEMGKAVQTAQGAFDTNVVLQVLKIEPRPFSRIGETEQRFAVTFVPIGPLPTTEHMVWDWVPKGAPIPYETGKQYRLALIPVAPEGEAS